VAVSADVIEHVSEPDKLLVEVCRVLRPSGMLALSTPLRLTERPLDAEHVREYFRSEVETLLQKHFDEINIKTIIPVAGLMLYYWRPWFFLRLPVIRLLMDLCDIVFQVNPVAGINALDRYHTGIIAVARMPRRAGTKR